MYSTLHYPTFAVNMRPEAAFCGSILRLPENEDGRKFEGGMRVEGRYKATQKEYPLVSVVTTVFNRQAVIERAICSVLVQSYPNVEYIIVDAASDDGTLEIIKKYEDVLDYIVSEPDTGIYSGMNKGICLASGDYVLLLNSDDWYHPQAVSQLVNRARSSDADIVSALSVEADEKGNTVRRIPKLPANDLIYLRMTLRHELMLVPRDVYENVGPYDESYRIIADLKFAQLAYRQYRIEQMDEYLMTFRSAGAAHHLKDFIEERKRLLSENFDFIDESGIHLLALAFQNDPVPYRELISSYPGKTRLTTAINTLLALHGH